MKKKFSFLSTIAVFLMVAVLLSCSQSPSKVSLTPEEAIRQPENWPLDDIKA